MLARLSVSDLALFSSETFTPDEGFLALTGETGAGKSLIVDALSFIAGRRHGREIIRHGSDKCSVSALFAPVDVQKRKTLSELGIETEEDGIELYRSLSREGRTVCRINGAQTTLTVLRQAAELFLDIHEQQDSHALLDAKNHVRYLDAFASDTLGEHTAAYRKAYEEYASRRAAFRALYEQKDTGEQEKEFLLYQIKELEGAKIKIGEFERLRELRERLNQSETYRAAIAAAEGALLGEDGAFDRLMAASAALAPLSECKELAERLESLAYEVQSFADGIPQPLEGEEEGLSVDRIDERLTQLKRLFHLYAPDEEGLLSLLDEKKARLSAIENRKEETLRLHGLAKEARDACAKIAARITACRKAAAEKLSLAVCERLSDLDMGGVRFSVHVEPLEKLSENGQDAVEFYVATNVGHTESPLCKTASGGELSRILLSLRCVLSDSDEIDTLVFDEIDTGVSGKSAVKIGRAMRGLGKKRQVLAVTHSAQVAAFANHQIKVEKTVIGDTTRAGLIPLSREGRREELARILGAEKPSNLARMAAEELLDSAEKEKME